MRLSVFIVTHGRSDLLRACCESVAVALPPECEVHIVVNGPDPKSLDWLREFNHPAFKIHPSVRESRALLRNFAFECCLGDIIYFLDDDVRVPSWLFFDALRKFDRDPALSVLGGPNLTPPESPWLEKIFGAVMTSAFAAPLIRARYGATAQLGQSEANEHKLILCNLAFRKASIPAQLRFRADLKSNEENLFLYHCRQLGLKAAFCTSQYVFHRRRSGLKGFLEQIESYGYGRAQQTLAAPWSTHVAFLVPAAAWVAIAGAVVSAQWLEAVMALSAVHLLLSTVFALASRSLRRLGFFAILSAIPLTGAMHLAYGLGFWKGVAFSVSRWLVAKSPQVEPPVVEADHRWDPV